MSEKGISPEKTTGKERKADIESNAKTLMVGSVCLAKLVVNMKFSIQLVKHLLVRCPTSCNKSHI